MRCLFLFLVRTYSSKACGLRSLPCSGFPLGFSVFLSPGSCPSASLVASGGQRPFPSFFFVSPAPAGLWGFAGFCTLCWPVVAEALISCGVAVSTALCVSSSFFMSLFVLHLLLIWGGLVTSLWLHLQLPGVGLFWSIGCTVLQPLPLAAPSPFFSPGVFFLRRLFGVRFVGYDPAWVSTLFWEGTLLSLSGILLGGSCDLVVQAPGFLLGSFLDFSLSLSCLHMV